MVGQVSHQIHLRVVARREPPRAVQPDQLVDVPADRDGLQRELGCLLKHSEGGARRGTARSLIELDDRVRQDVPGAWDAAVQPHVRAPAGEQIVGADLDHVTGLVTHTESGLAEEPSRGLQVTAAMSSLYE